MSIIRLLPSPASAATTWLAVCHFLPCSSLLLLTIQLDVGGSKGVSRVQSVSDGAMLSFEIRAWPADASKERLERGHKGPCAVYLKKVSSAIEDTGTHRTVQSVGLH